MSFKFTLLVFFNLFLIGLSLVVGLEDFSPFSLGETQKYIFFDLRIPRTLSLLSIGCSLALSGVLLQTLLNNPLAEPYTLGLSGGATLGAVIFLYLGVLPDWFSLPLGAATGCLVVTIIILSSLKKNFFWKKNSLILTGVMISLFCGSLVTLIISLLDPARVQLAVFWMMGQVGSTRDHWWIFLLPAFALVLLFFYINRIHLDRFLLGQESAKNLGTKVETIRLFIIISVCILTSISVSIAGLVGFIGLIAPHLSYLFFKTSRHQMTLIVSPLIGSALFILSDILSRQLSTDSEIPAGSLMAILGAPLLIFLISKRSSHAPSK